MSFIVRTPNGMVGYRYAKLMLGALSTTAVLKEATRFGDRKNALAARRVLGTGVWDVLTAASAEAGDTNLVAREHDYMDRGDGMCRCGNANHEEGDRGGTLKMLHKSMDVTEIAQAWLDKSDKLAASLPADMIVRMLLDWIENFGVGGADND